MNTYTYSYRNDHDHEPIGRVRAMSLEEAAKQITVIKQLQPEQCDMLFVINQEEGHANRFQSDIHR
jgi:hypothetical protein